MKTKKQDKKQVGKKDAFGSLLGTNRAKINACLTKTPKTMAELLKETGLKVTYYQHLKQLAAAKLVKKTDKGYVRSVS